MGITLRLLIIEDSHRDVLLEVRALEAGGYVVHHTEVSTAAEMKSALAEQAFDLIISDHDLPQFDAPGALAVFNESGLDIPFIIVSGAIGEEMAVALMKAGAHDYVSKDKLTRLAVTVEHALQDVEDRRGRKQAEEQRFIALEKYRVLVESFPLGIIITDAQGNIVEANKESERMLGLTRDGTLQTMYERPEWQIISPDGTPMPPDEYDSVRVLKEKQRTVNRESGIIKENGGARWISITTEPIPLENYGVAITYEDITDRKLAEEALKESEEQFRTVLENAPDGVYINDFEGNFLYGNRRCEEIIGYRSEELIGKNFLELNILPENSLARAAGILKDNINGKATGPDELELIAKNGRLVLVEINTTVVQQKGKAVVLAFVRDITSRKQAEQELQQSQDRYRTLVEKAFEGIVVIQDGQVVFANSRAYEIIGYPRDQVGLRPFMDFIHAEDRQQVIDRHVRRLKGEQFEETYPIRLVDRDGNIKWAMISTVRIDWAGSPATLTLLTDISEIRRAGDALRESEAQYRLLADNTVDGVWLLDMNLKLIYCSPASEKQSGFTAQEIKAMSLDRYFTPGSLKVVTEAFLEEIPKAMADPAYNDILTLELEFYKKDGTAFWAECKFSIIRDKQGKPVSILGQGRDISERKLAAEKLARSYDTLKKTLNDAVDTMAKIVETRDPYTAGHQQRVADLATAIAREMKLDDTRIDQLRMAAVIHDIGKMYIPSDILSKPGKLSDIEFSLIRTHSQFGYDIIKGMDFPCNVAKAVLQHHERLDGSGYPHQLKGEDMILEAKILAVADVVEAMSSHRPYRPAQGIEKAFEEISINRGCIYDPDVVDACLDLFNSGRFQFKPV